MSDSWLTSYVERGPKSRELFAQAKRNTAGGGQCGSHGSGSRRARDDASGRRAHHRWSVDG